MTVWTLTMPRKIDTIVIHCSASPHGTVSLIDEWHKARGWSGCGYHYVICNCYPTPTSWVMKRPEPDLDGLLQTGRPLDNDIWLEDDEIGAHAYGFNRTSIGICLIGDRHFTSRQLETLHQLILKLKNDLYGTDIRVVGHYELDDKKTCPNLDMDYLRSIYNS